MKSKITQNLAWLITAVLLTVNGYSQNALDFDGMNDYVTTTYNGVMGDSARTIEAWVKSYSGNGEQIIVAYGNENSTGGRFTFRLKQISTTKDVIRIEIKGSGLDGNINVGDSTWHHVAVTFDPTATTKYALYVDGVLDNSGNLSTTLNTISGTPVRIGRRIHPIYTGYFDGNIDEVRIWNVARTASDLQSSMNDEFCAVPQGLKAYYKMNDGTAGGNNASVTMATDAVAGNDGTLLNFALSGNGSNWISGKNLATGSSTPGSTSITSCGPYTANTGDVWTTSGNYVDTIASPTGCDSILNIALTVKPNSSNTVSATGCNSYTAPSGSQTWTQSGTFHDTLPSANGCDSILTINLTINTVDTSVLANGAYLTAYANGAAYQWLDCDNGYATIAGATGQTYQATANGNYAVEINDNGCIDTSGCHNVDNIGLLENSFENGVSVYPNPATNMLRIAIAEQNANATISIVNMLGKVVATKIQDTGRTIEMPLELPSGIYFVKVEVNNQIAIKKLTIQ